MKIRFTKMQGCGNDYVYINGFTEKVPQEKKPEFVRFASDRHFGIGGDGVIFINPSDEADFEMEMYNADGTRAEMCGNGIRCVAKYVHDKGLTDQTQFSIVSGGKVKYMDLTVENGITKAIRVDMGEPILTAAEVPVVSKNEQSVDEEIVVDNEKYRMTCVSMGNPNCVIHLDEISKEKAMELGPYVENASYFPNRINMQLCKVMDRGHIRVEIYERGAGYTYASGTGACAAASAAHKLGLVGNRVQVHMQGGDLLVEFAEDDRVFMTGPVVYIGSITLAENFLA